MTFADFFHAATGNPPFPWQSNLFDRFAAGNYPTTANLPTGLGKTSIVAIWLIALALHPEKTPRRLVYVVNRRTVVDQTTTEVEKIRKALTDNQKLKEVVDTLRGLCALPLPKPDSPPLAVSTLRGQFADNREWSADPARPAVIIGTVDMIGSGLLFSRYTVGFKLRPHHAAFLGQDALLVHDEAHLEPAFQTLLESIVAEQARSNDLHKLRVMELSATTRSDGSAIPFKISNEDESNEIIHKRIHASKKLTLIQLQEKEKEPDRIVELALEKKDSGRTVLIFVRTVDSALKIAEQLKKQVEQKNGSERVLTLTGTIRGKERDELVTKPLFQRFLQKGQSAGKEETVWLVATSAGEVGVNMSACHLICDVSTFESMAQRFGRVNRYGEYTDSSVTLVYPSEFPHAKKLKEAEKAVSEGKKDAEKKLKALEAKETFSIAREKTLNLLKMLENSEGGVCPAGLELLPANERAAAFSPLPKIRTATAIQYDAWALTSIRKPIAARQPVAPYLHGEETEWQPPETHVAWRTDPDKIKGDLLTAAFPPDDLIDSYPLKPHELLRDSSRRIAEILSDRIDAYISENPDDRHVLPPAWLIGESEGAQLLELASKELVAAYKKGSSRSQEEKKMIKQHKKDLEDRLADATIILPASLGGIDSGTGIFSASAQSFGNDTDVSEIKDKRCRIVAPSPDIPDEFSKGWRLVRVVDTETGKDEPSESSDRYWLWLEAEKNIDGETKTAEKPETLYAHSRAVFDNICAISRKLFPTDNKEKVIDWEACFRAAASWHDSGKDRRLWQLGIGNTGYDPNNPETILAKSGRSMRGRNLARHYRHEFGAVRTITTLPAERIQKETPAPFSAIEQDLVLHLIAAHHGRARPHFPTEEVFDYEGGPDQNHQVAMEIPRRFARLQNRFGRWGLAWIESILRAADYAASAGIIAETSASPFPNPVLLRTLPASRSEYNHEPIRLRVDVLNPGQYFACCGLFELASSLSSDVQAHFEEDQWKQWWFIINSNALMQSAQEFSLFSLLNLFQSAELTAADSEPCKEEQNDESAASESSDMKASPLCLGTPFNLRLDWWETASRQTSGLKVWAGSMDCFRIAGAMQAAVGKILLSPGYTENIQNILFDSRVVYEQTGKKPKKVEPFCFDAQRGPNADARDVGFSPNTLSFETLAAPAVEVLSLIGLQRGVPAPADKPRQFIYHLWTKPVFISLLGAAIGGLLPDASTHAYRFESWFRTSQKKHKAFLAAQPMDRI